MPRNSSGVYSTPNTFTPGTKISSASVNANFSDIATALTSSIATDGTSTVSGQIKFAPGSAPAPGICFSNSATSGIYHAGSGKIGISGAGSLTILVDPTALGTGQSGNILTSGTGAVFAPVGMIVSYAGATAPTGWILCYGQNVNRANHPELSTVLNAASFPYGSGDGLTTFGLPDLRGRAVAGKDNMGGVAASRLTASYFGTSAAILGAVGGSESHTLTIAKLPSHNHTGSSLSTDGAHTHSESTSAVNNQAAQAGSGAALNSGLASTTTGSNGSHTHTLTIASQGGGEAHNNTQPTIVLNYIIYSGR